MVHWIQPSTTTSRIVTTVLLGIAEVTTVTRLTLRIRTKRFWFDDAWAIVAFILSFADLVNLWIRTDPARSKHSRIIAYWMVSLCFTGTLWASRMSVIFSVLRIIPPHLRLRKITAGFAALFAMMWMGLLAQKTYRCAKDKSWYHLPSPQCHLGTQVAVLELCTDLIADVVLAAVPISLLRAVKAIDVRQRNLVIIIFAASLLTTLASIVHAVFLLGPSGLLEATTAQAEAAVALLVANAPVVVPSIYRIVVKKPETQPDYSINSNGVLRMHRTPPKNFEESTIAFKQSNASLTALGSMSVKPDVLEMESTVFNGGAKRSSDFAN